MAIAASMILPFPDQGHIALVVRGKRARGQAPDGEGHADVIMPSGAPAGFFVDPATEDAGTYGMDVPGCVYGYSLFAARRPHYVNLADAQATRCVSGVLLIRVTAAEAEAFTASWRRMRAAPGNFVIAGWNCASHAALAFARAGLVGREIPGLDTPDNLFHALLSRHRARCRDEYGYLGFMPRESHPDELQLQCDVGMEGAPWNDLPGGPPPPVSSGDAARPGRRASF